VKIRDINAEDHGEAVRDIIKHAEQRSGKQAAAAPIEDEAGLNED
jgi:hypothetical protein